MGRGTFSGLRSLPIRWRLAGGSALLTLVILLGFAVIVGALTVSRIRFDFHEQVRLAAEDLQDKLTVRLERPGARPRCVGPDPEIYGSADNAVVRLVTLDGAVICPEGAPDLGPPLAEEAHVNGYYVQTRRVRIGLALPTGGTRFFGDAFVQYARPVSDVEETVRRVKIFLGLGVLGGAALALLAGLAIARRAMTPIAELTAAAREIERTRDPARRVPRPDADDEVAELARTLDEMLRALDESRAETEAMLRRQREFVADASHELRTPLTSVLANLELLVDVLDGESGEAARSALRSSRRMRRLVADLLLLARADVGRAAPHGPTDLAEVVVEAAAELEPVADGHELSVDARPAVVEGARDDLHRLVVNLMENAIRHTPAGTHVRASVSTDNGHAVLAVEDDGPGIPEDLVPLVFDRFVRGAGDRGGSFGLGLAIVRAVADSHGGTVSLEPPAGEHGTRFVVRLPVGAGSAQPPPGPAQGPSR